MKAIKYLCLTSLLLGACTAPQSKDSNEAVKSDSVVRVNSYQNDRKPLLHVEEGEKMIDGELFDLQGNRHRLADLKGKYILLDFWYHKCGACIRAIPETHKLDSMYKDKLHIVSVSIDGKKQWEESSRKHPMAWHNWNDLKRAKGIYAGYMQDAFPNYTLISPEGIVLEQWAGYGKGSLLKKMEEYLGKK